MITFRQIIPVVLAFFSLFIACTNEEPAEITDEFKTINIADSLGLDSGDARVFLLPAPLQIVSALNVQNIPYKSDLISTLPKNLEGHTEYLIALNLGVNTIDLGYATVYGDHQVGLNYSKNVKELMDLLGIRSAIKKRMVTRFEKNVDNQDSLCSIILDAYSASHEYFQLNQREGVGLLILTGCFIEGLYLATGVDQAFSNRQIHGLIALHKEYSANILLLLRYYRNSDEVADLLVKLENLNVELNTLNYEYNATKGKATLDMPIPEEKFAAIKAAILEIRNSIRI